MSERKRIIPTSELSPDDRLRLAVDVMVEAALKFVRGEDENGGCSGVAVDPDN